MEAHPAVKEVMAAREITVGTVAMADPAQAALLRMARPTPVTARDLRGRSPHRVLRVVVCACNSIDSL